MACLYSDVPCGKKRISVRIRVGLGLDLGLGLGLDLGLGRRMPCI